MIFPMFGQSEETIKNKLKQVKDSIEERLAGTLPGKPDTYPHSLAIETLAYISELNPNNSGIHTRSLVSDIAQGRSSPWEATRQLEKEVIAQLADLYNLNLDELDGYITSGATEGNLAALWIGRNNLLQTAPTTPIAVIAPQTAHYSLRKVCNLLKLGEGNWRLCPQCGHLHELIPAVDGSGLYLVDVDDNFALDLDAFEKRLEQINSLGIKRLLVVATIGTTITGSVDPIPDICHRLRLAKEKYGIISNFHVDAAFGGLVLPFIDINYMDWSKWPEVTSLCLDWHKMGLVPYGAGTLLCRKNMVASVQQQVGYTTTGIDATVVGSRSGALAAAIWAVVQVMGVAGFQAMVSHCMKIASHLRDCLKNIPQVEVLPPASVNLVALRFKQKHSTQAKELLTKHRIHSEWLSKSANQCPEEIFPIYLMPHVTTDDVEQFVSDLANSFYS